MDPNEGLNPSFTHSYPCNSAVAPRTFKSDVRDALSSCYPTRSKQNAYRRVHVLILSWDNAPEHNQELYELSAVFRRIYDFEVQVFKLPTDTATPAAHLVWALSFVIESLDKRDLVLFYYAGHASHDETSNPSIYKSLSLTSNVIKRDDLQRAEYQHTIELNQVFGFWQRSRDRSNAPTPEEKRPDILIMLDCCYPGSEAIPDRFELLAASGMGHVTTAGSGFPSASFTANLTKLLSHYGGRPMSVAQIHSDLVRGHYSGDLATAPFHVEISEEMIKRGSIILASLKDRAASTAAGPSSARPWIYQVPQPTVLLSIAINGITVPPSPITWLNWLLGGLPSGIIIRTNIEVLGYYEYRAQSGVLMVSMPIEVWNTLRGRKAYVFHGYRTVERSLYDLSDDEDSVQVDLPLRTGKSFLDKSMLEDFTDMTRS